MKDYKLTKYISAYWVDDPTHDDPRLEGKIRGEVSAQELDDQLEEFQLKEKMNDTVTSA